MGVLQNVFYSPIKQETSSTREKQNKTKKKHVKNRVPGQPYC